MFLKHSRIKTSKLFLTAHEEFAIKAIKFSALDYILKPIDPDELKSALVAALASMSLKEESQFKALQNNLQPISKKKIGFKNTRICFCN